MMKVTVKTFSKLAMPECDIISIDGRKIKRLKRKGYRIEIISDLKLFSHYCGRWDGARQEFWLVPEKSMNMYQLSTHVYDMVKSRQLYFNKSFRCHVKEPKTTSLRNFLEIDHDCDELWISNITNPRIVPVNLFRIFKDDRDFTKWKLTQ